MEDVLNSEGMQKLATMVEEAMRSTEHGVKYFVEPADGTLRSATSKRHHIVFGRRGSGKTSLLRKAGADLTVGRRPIAFVDLETFKGHSYPDVLLSVLIATFEAFQVWINTAAIHPASKKSFWHRFFGTVPTHPALNKKDSAKLSTRLGECVRTLNEQLHAADAAEIQRTTAEDELSRENGEVEGLARVPVAAGRAKVQISQTKYGAEETKESFKRSKLDFLHRHILDYRDIFREMHKLSDGDSYLFLDDLYHIKRQDQPHVVDYFHRIAKGQGLWLKIGTIRHRTTWYVPGDPPTGMKLADDADAIDLDVTLDKYDLAREFLEKILVNFARETTLQSLNRFLTERA